jgi:hypothetical protein
MFLLSDGVQFRLSDRWYGKVQVKHNGEWGRVCNANWGNKEASTLCRQLGYVDGRAENTPSKSSGMIRMDNVNCTGTESSILECNHRSSWTDSLGSCNDARAICNTTSTYIFVRFVPFIPDKCHFSSFFWPHILHLESFCVSVLN